MNSKNSFKIGLLFFLGSFGMLAAQEQEKNKELLKLEKEAQTYLADGSEELSKDNFPDAEVNYRKAISIYPSEEIGKYNLGNAYYNREQNEEAMMRFMQAASTATSKPEKHKAFHNLGNTFMNAKKYQEAVEAYKNALRNNPTDDETRYNLALAKEMLEKNPPQGGDGEDENNDQKDNQDQNQDQESKENQDNQDQNKEGDEGEDKDNKDQGEDKEEQNKGDEEGDNKQPQENQQPPKNEQGKPKQGQMSPQQVKNLLDAMNNEEKKVQDKINVQKQKGAKVKSNKDW